MIGATPDGSYGRQQGSHDGPRRHHRHGHRRVATRTSRRTSTRGCRATSPSTTRRSTAPAPTSPTSSCEDPANVDEDGHGTHVAVHDRLAAQRPGHRRRRAEVDLVNLRAGQDSGYFFLGPTLDALTYAGDHGIDVVNMSFYIDPWLFNCTANPADSPAEQREQRLDHRGHAARDRLRAHRGVTTIAAEGNGHTDLGKPDVGRHVARLPVAPTATRRRATADRQLVPVACRPRPTASSASPRSGPSTRKAYYSDYGTEQADVAAPGGDAYDTATGRPARRT